MNTKHQSGTRVSEYLLESVLGVGSFGEVWKAQHHVWKNDYVAIKLPTEPQYVRYLQREGLVVHGLRHPNIVRVLGIDPYSEPPYLVMELVEGPSLREVIAEHRNGLPLNVVQTVTRGVLNAMKAAHDNGVLHRDLKPGNVLLHMNGKTIDQLEVDDVKVTDFGLGLGAKEMLDSIAQSASMERDNRLIGTLPYMGPEVRDGVRQPDKKSDLFAVGVMLFEMLTGARPAGAELPSTIRADAGLFDHLFQKLYARYDRRYERADDALRDLKPTGQGAPPPAPMTSARVGGANDAYRIACPACKAPVEPNDQFCTQCGRQLATRVLRCGSCGAYPSPDDRFCIFCGASIANDGEH